MKSEDTWFAQRLRYHRERADLTQVELAEAMDVSEQTVRQWERGAKFPHLRKLPQLGQVLGVQPGCFFPGPGDPLEWSQVVREPVTPPLRPGLEAIEAQLQATLQTVRSLRKNAAKKK